VYIPRCFLSLLPLYSLYLSLSLSIYLSFGDRENLFPHPYLQIEMDPARKRRWEVEAWGRGLVKREKYAALWNHTIKELYVHISYYVT
jgi:hypothetical protein